MSCVFCMIRDGQIPSTRVHEDDRTIAFMDINPINPGHLLVVPKAHAPTVLDVADEDLVACYRAAKAHQLDVVIDGKTHHLSMAADDHVLAAGGDVRAVRAFRFRNKVEQAFRNGRFQGNHAHAVYFLKLTRVHDFLGFPLQLYVKRRDDLVSAPHDVRPVLLFEILPNEEHEMRRLYGGFMLRLE